MCMYNICIHCLLLLNTHLISFRESNKPIIYAMTKQLLSYLDIVLLIN